MSSIDEALRGTKYAQATEGKWENDYEPDNEEQMGVVVGVPDTRATSGKWGMYQCVAELSCNCSEQGRPAANIALVTDAKTNAALAAHAERLAEALEICMAILEMDGGASPREADEAYDAFKRLQSEIEG